MLLIKVSFSLLFFACWHAKISSKKMFHNLDRNLQGVKNLKTLSPMQMARRIRMEMWMQLGIQTKVCRIFSLCLSCLSGIQKSFLQLLMESNILFLATVISAIPKNMLYSPSSSHCTRIHFMLIVVSAV